VQLYNPPCIVKNLATASLPAIAGPTFLIVLVLINVAVVVTLSIYTIECRVTRKKRKVTREETKKHINPVDLDGNPFYGDYSLGSMEVEMVDRNVDYGGEGVAQVEDANPMYHADSPCPRQRRWRGGRLHR
jgi:hypothetical protein